MALRRETDLGPGTQRRHGNIRKRFGNRGGPGVWSDPGGSGRYRPACAADIRRWAAWLRASAARQARGSLRRVRSDGTVRVCALGALEELAGIRPVLFGARVEARFLRRVVHLNDEAGWSFDQIATWLELIARGALSLDDALRVRVVPVSPAGAIRRSRRLDR